MSTMMMMPPTPICVAQDMSVSFDSEITQIGFVDNVDIQCKWTGVPVGTLTVYVNMDPSKYSWQALTFNPAEDQPTGSSGSNWYALNNMGGYYVKLSYVRTSGTGTFDAAIGAKSV